MLTGTAVAVHDGRPNFWAGLGALAVGLAMQLGVNFANDYSDHVRGADRIRTGPVRAASSGIVAPDHVRWAAVVSFGVAAAAGLALSIAVDWRLLLVGAASILAGWLYTGGPRPYGYLGLGEVFVFVFFGLVATTGTEYVETGRITGLGVLMGCGTGFLASAILVLNNLRDIDTDRTANKRTLATRIGRQGTRWLLAAFVAAAFAVLLLAGAWPGLLAIPIALVAVAGAFTTTSPPLLVRALQTMAIAELAYALLFTLWVLL